MLNIKQMLQFQKGDKRVSNLSICKNKVQTAMARKCMNPYELCNKAGISYQSYRRIMIKGGCKIATLGKIAAALGVDVTEIIEMTKER